MKRALLGLLLLLEPIASRASDVPVLALPPIDFGKVNAEDARAKDSAEALRYAVPRELDITPGNAGVWDAHDGLLRWRWRVEAPDAVHLNFGFIRYVLPPSATLTVLGADGEPQFRAFTAADNEAHGELWTPPVFGTAATLELTVAPRERAALELVLGRIGQGYRGFGRIAAGAKSGSCNTDTQCLAADDPWATTKRAVGVLSNDGFRYCSGSLVNNTANDARMLFMTATHCNVTAGNAASLVVVWNFEAPACRQPGGASSGSGAVVGSLTQFNSGAVFRAATPYAGGSDTTLVELDDPADPAHGLYWPGWDHGTAPAACSVAAPCASIHHPDGAEKRITFSHTDFVVGTGNVLQWFVQWASQPPNLPNFPVAAAAPPGVTEPGSSGSPIYNASHRVVGVLTGGASFCGAPEASLNDVYGMLAHAWEGLGTDATRMRTWLDPVGTGPTAIGGRGAGLELESGFEDGE